MIEWLLASIDASRPHSVDVAVAWHGRLMVLAWAVLLPLGILVARFGKIWPRQDWPRTLDSKIWWHAHLTLQYAGSFAVLIAVGLVWRASSGTAVAHALFGWAVVAFTLVQVVSGLLRGSKGGPTAPQLGGSLHGDHYAMTRRRRVFERVHKSVGVVAVLAAVVALGTGLWLANAPRWMWLALVLWWSALIAVAVTLQRRGRAVDTYQAIWGPDPAHPGNRLKPIGIGIRRPQTPKGGS